MNVYTLEAMSEYLSVILKDGSGASMGWDDAPPEGLSSWRPAVGGTTTIYRSVRCDPRVVIRESSGCPSDVVARSPVGPELDCLSPPPKSPPRGFLRRRAPMPPRGLRCLRFWSVRSASVGRSRGPRRGSVTCRLLLPGGGPSPADLDWFTCP